MQFRHRMSDEVVGLGLTCGGCARMIVHAEQIATTDSDRSLIRPD
jgi:hypothetical protein